MTLLGPTHYEVTRRRATEGLVKLTDGASLQSNITKLHVALPFTEGERDRLWDESAILWGDMRWRTEPLLMARDYTHRIKDEAEDRTIYEAGRQRLIVGQNILGAWWAWRRAAFEFEGQESVDLARNALRGIGDILLPPARNAD
jgi:hypothetical protein